jgi:transposase-like protein
VDTHHGATVQRHQWWNNPPGLTIRIRRHLADKVSTSDLCEEYKIRPSLFYPWQRQLLDNAPSALTPSKAEASLERKLASKVEALQFRLQRKDSVIAERLSPCVRVVVASPDPSR